MQNSLKNYGARTVLIIDDDTDLQHNFRQVFEMEDYNVQSAKNGQEALDLLESTTELPDMILLDFNMPVMDGGEFYKRLMLEARFAGIPVVLMTASGDLHPIMNQIQADAFIAKPLSIDHLLKVTFNFVHRSQNSRYSFLA